MTASSRPALPWKGSCQCGQVQITLSEPPLTLYACHCLDCQKAASSAFGMSMRVTRSGLSVKGKTNIFIRDGGTDKEVHCHFCPDCGSRIIHDRTNRADNVNLKAGLLDDTSHLKTVGNLWTKRKQPWLVLDDSQLNYDGQPENYDDLITAYRASWIET